MENKNQLLSQTFMWLFIGLLVCFGVSYFTTLSDEAIQTVYGSFNGLGYIIFIILELVVAIAEEDEATEKKSDENEVDVYPIAEQVTPIPI